MGTSSGNAGAPLAGIKVLDVSRVAAGPVAALILADLGADVIKVERPPHGDDTRRMDARPGEPSGYYMGVNRGKRDIGLDFSKPEDVEVALELGRQADVLIENFRPGVADSLGIGYERLSKDNPGLVFCSISSFGLEGEWKERLAYDIIAQAVTGIMSITGEPDRGPAKSGPPIADVSCGLMAAIGVQAALVARGRTGLGQKVDTSLVGSALMLSIPFLTSRALGTTYARVGGGHNTVVPYQAFEGSDGRWFIVAVAKESMWKLLITLPGLEHLGDDERYRSNALRAHNRKPLVEFLKNYFLGKPAQDWVKDLDAAGAPAFMVNTFDDVIAAQHFRDNGYVADLGDGEGDPLPFVMTPLRFSGTDNVGARSLPPDVDQHGDRIRAAIAGGTDPWAVPLA